MNFVKKIAKEQTVNVINRVAKQMRGVQIPKDGWLFTVRNALGMSVEQLARRLNVTRGHIYRVERSENSGRVTLKTMRALAEAMGCRFVYAIVPENSVEDLLEERARIVADRLVHKTSRHMALEDQVLSNKQISDEIKRIQSEILKDMPSDFWSDQEY
jgi:predicted DNA-binding mobile mystery protein A